MTDSILEHWNSHGLSTLTYFVVGFYGYLKIKKSLRIYHAQSSIRRPAMPFRKHSQISQAFQTPPPTLAQLVK
jgi:hypothetical protein